MRRAMAFRLTALLGLLVAGAGSATPRTEFVQVSPDLTLHYRSTGSGPRTLVFVPGWTMSLEVFTRQFEHFRDSRTVRFISFDPRSQGLSTHTSSGNHYEQHGRDLAAFLKALEISKAVLAGWSNGAFDVLSYLHQFGDAAIEAVILIDGAPRGSGEDNQKDWVWFRRDDADHYRESITLGVLRDRPKSNADFADWMVEHPTPEYRRWIIGIGNQTADEVAGLLNETSAYQDYEADLAAYAEHHPVLILSSAEKGPIAAAWAAAHAPTADVQALGRHLMFWEHADEFNASIERFLAR